MVPKLAVAAVLQGSFPASEPILEDLDQAGEALARLAELAGVEVTQLGAEGAWSARVTVDGTELWLRARGESWSIWAARETDAGEAMSAARRLHGLLGAQAEGWDLDR